MVRQYLDILTYYCVFFNDGFTKNPTGARGAVPFMYAIIVACFILALEAASLYIKIY